MEVIAPSIPYKMIIVYLTTFPKLRAYNSFYMQNYFRQFFLFSFLIKMSMVKAKGTVFYKSNCIMAKAKEKLYFFIPLGIPRVTYLIVSFVLKISMIISSRQADTKYRLIC